MSTRDEIETGIEGFRLWPGALSVEAQTALRDAVLEAEKAAPFYRPTTPGGRPFSVRMTNLGPFGWVSDQAGYRYQSRHPLTDDPRPPTPEPFVGLWR